MNTRVVKNEFVNRCEDKGTEIEAGVSTDQCANLGECRSCPNILSTNEVLSLVMKCANFAAEKHSKQKRKDAFGTPYINHPIGAFLLNNII